ncbi:Hypothetical predicted protein [Octopus vulgaris]|uniref:Uncharacterized protein n=1 Tax=Octopus vulgaris TaxID=6645 RepID=A0AA36BC86_OCTVU|nr:Hypothetical predicted protein [Octopus vulgaris]
MKRHDLYGSDVASDDEDGGGGEGGGGGGEVGLSKKVKNMIHNLDLLTFKTANINLNNNKKVDSQYDSIKSVLKRLRDLKQTVPNSRHRSHAIP